VAFENYDRNRLFELIYTGLVGVHNLPKDLFRQTFDNLFDGMNAGLGIQYNYNDPILIRELTENIYLFSGAKTAVQLMDMKGAMIGADGKLLSFSQFKKIADEKFNLYNVDYLKTEYNTAVGQGQMVSKWTEFVENTEQFPMLQYDAVMDGRTSPICRPLDGIILPVDDPFWKQYSPLNHFNCRCQLIRLSVYDDPKKTTPKKLEKASETAKETVSDVFKMNPFYDKVIFSKKHPYFEAVANIPGFKLPIIEKPIVPKQPKEKLSKPQLKTKVESIFKNNFGLNVNDVMFSSEMPIELLDRYINEIDKLTKEYKTSFNVNDSMVKLQFKSTSRTYGFVEHYSNKYSKINFGDKTNPKRILKDRITLNENNMISSTAYNSKVDEINEKIATLYHEFAHVISVDYYAPYWNDNTMDFWHEIKSIKRKYNTEVKKLVSTGNYKELNNIFLGEYAGKNNNEFMAEAFTEYKLKSNPSKYAVEVGQLIDKYFKK
jgi:SPP1 gp7 family putative phage head morphogenesis protein